MPSKKQQACVTRYVSAHYDQIKITVPKGQRERYKTLAARLGVSVNQLFVQAVENYIADHVAELSEPSAPADSGDPTAPEISAPLAETN